MSGLHTSKGESVHLRRLTATLGVLALSVGSLTACTSGPIVVIPSISHTAGPAYVVGIPAVPDGSNPLEGALLAHVYAAALDAAGAKATIAAEDPKDPTLLDKLGTGAVDLVPGYSSSFLDVLAPHAQVTATSQVLDALKSALPAGVSMLDPAKAQDNDALVVTTVTAQKYNLKTIADLAKVCDKLAFGGSEDFRTKEHGLATLGSDYNCVPKTYEELPNTSEELLLALLRDKVQVADIHSSSPAIEDNALVVLTDTKQVFQAQSIVPLVSAKNLPADIASVINKVTAALTNEELINLNRLADGSNNASLDQAAHAWLVLMGLLKATS